MALSFTSGKWAIAECDICAQRYKLNDLKKVVVKGVVTNTKACPTCWDVDHPQLMQGKYPVVDPQAVREPRTDLSLTYDTVHGSISTQWGWNPVGGGSSYVQNGPNSLIGTASVGTVTVAVS